MPILKINILGSNIELNFQENEREKLENLIKNFKLRLSKLEDLKNKYSDNKIIFLAALQAENDIYESNKEKIKNFNNENIKTENEKKIKEIIDLKDQILELSKKNRVLEEQNKFIEKQVDKLNKKLISLIDKIIIQE